MQLKPHVYGFCSPAKPEAFFRFYTESDRGKSRNHGCPWWFSPMISCESRQYGPCVTEHCYWCGSNHADRSSQFVWSSSILVQKKHNVDIMEKFKLDPLMTRPFTKGACLRMELLLGEENMD
ncbi:hypothetical protein V6N13_029846 [Hibiscus sabdariffa]|uniref:Uncharacterized protein n=2 Tax=Hibiscus sabdariffa TaxID=183260 RepID=A0ABR1ZNE1_9ROSI